MMARYEFHAKGADVFIKALGNLNRKLKEEKNDRTNCGIFGYVKDHGDQKRSY